MLPSAECRRRRGGLGAYQRKHNFGRVTTLRATRTAWLVRHRPRLAIRRPNAIEHASLEVSASLDLHVRQVERLVVEPQRDGRDGKPAENMLR